MNIKMPTSDQCTNHEKVYEDDRNTGYAIWYPQMGGYSAKAIAIMNKKWTKYQNGSALGGCLELLVWHDGNFPFHNEDGEEESPTILHHCDPEQFIEFGKKLSELNNLGKIEEE